MISRGQGPGHNIVLTVASCQQRAILPAGRLSSGKILTAEEPHIDSNSRCVPKIMTYAITQIVFLHFCQNRHKRFLKKGYGVAVAIPFPSSSM